MKIIKAFTHCFARKFVQRTIILYQIILFIFLIYLLYQHSDKFDDQFKLACYLYLIFHSYCSIVETDSAMFNPMHSIDLTTISVVLFMQIFLSIWCISLFLALFLTIDVEDTDSAKFHVAIIFIADFVNQISWALYLIFRFIRKLFPREEERVIYQDIIGDDHHSVVIEDYHEVSPCPQDEEVGEHK